MNTQHAQHRTYRTLPVNDLAELAAKYEEKWPEIMYTNGGSRAQKAMSFVVEGRIWSEGRDCYGNDVWVVNGNRCSKEGKWCECQDRVRTDLTYGKLCAHRLAVALKTNWLGDKNQALVDALAQLTMDHLDDGSLTLVVDRYYDRHGDGERFAVAGFVDERHRHHKWPADLRIEANLPQMQHALSTVDWSLADLPVKLPGWSDYLYTIQPGPGLELTPELFFHKGRTPQMEERERSRRMVLADIAANLPVILQGPIPIHLSEWETKRVYELRQELMQQEATAIDIWSRLPSSLRAAIIEREAEMQEEVFA
jgi:hypothetical protein